MRFHAAVGTSCTVAPHPECRRFHAAAAGGFGLGAVYRWLSAGDALHVQSTWSGRLICSRAVSLAAI